MASIKGPAPAPTSFPGADKLRIGIVHARWNEQCITPLVNGAVQSITNAGVKPENIVIESVPGSWELPIGTSRLIAASQVQAASNVSDLMGATSLLDGEGSRSSTPAPASGSRQASRSALDAVISIGVLIKGSTMHFEYISESCCSGLMKVGLDTNVPVILGVLTALTEDQALERSGVGRGANKGHNHGLDWGNAAVEMALKANRWAEGKLNA
ncbi:lumazine synthase [Thecaphora frezii]